MRTLMAIVVALIVGALVWTAASLVLNILDLLRGDTGWLQRLFVEFFTPAVGAFAGVHAADKVAKQYSLDGLYFGFCAAVVAATVVVALYMHTVAARANWRVFDWMVMVVTPLGAVAGASVARAGLSSSTGVPR